MSYSPIMSGGVIVEVPKSEYEKLIRSAEKIDAVERLVSKSNFVSTGDVLALLGIKEKTKAEQSDNNTVCG